MLSPINHPVQVTTNRQLTVRLAVTRALSRARDLAGIYNAALDALAECVGVSRAAVLLFDPDGVMRFKAHRGISSTYVSAVQGHSPWTPGSTNPVPLVVSDVTLEPSLQPYLPHILRERIGAMAFIPLVSLGRVIGKFMIYHDEPHPFDEEEVQLATVIAAAVAFAVERANSEEGARRASRELPPVPIATSFGAWEWDVSASHSAGSETSLAGLPSGTLRQVHRCTLDGSADCLGILDLGGRVSFINAEGLRMLGLRSADAVLHREMADLWHDVDKEAVYEAFARARSGMVGTFRGWIATSAGALKWRDVTVAPITDGAGHVVQLLATSRDVSAPWQGEAYRAGQHQILELIATGTPLSEILTLLAHLIEEQCEGMLCSVVLLDTDGVHMRLGAAPSLPPTYPGQVVDREIGPDAGPCGVAMHQGRVVIVKDIRTDPMSRNLREVAIARGLHSCWAAPILSPQKRMLGAFELFYTTPREPDDAALRLIETARDLAGVAIEHCRSEEALRRSEERNRAILRALPDWVFILSRDGVFLDYHGRHPDNLLMPPEEFLGRSAYDVLPPPIAETHRKGLEGVFSAGEPANFEYSLDVRGETHFYEACIVPCGAEEALSIVRDITDRKRAELDASEQRAELAHLNRALLLGELSGALAHELSQPLAATLINAQAARRLTEEGVGALPEVRASLDDTIENVKRAGAVIRRLRTLLRKGESAFQPLYLHEVAAEVLDLIHSDLLVRRIMVSSSIPESTPPIRGDRVQLQQVILNLMLNGCDAMMDCEPAERELSLAILPGTDFVQLSISDRGHGIPEDQLTTIFEPFVTSRKHGLGLGLAISRSIVRAHGGRIVAENNPTCGATFSCFLPVMDG